MKGAAVAFALAAVLAVPAAQAGPEVTLLLHHPYPDYGGADPFGFSYQGGEAYFFQLYAPLSADGRFDYPFFIADGDISIVGPVNASQPFAAAQRAYDGAVQSRLRQETPVVLRLDTVLSGSSAALAIQVDPVSTLPGEHLHLRVALAEDPVHFLGPPNLNNGITKHRFTVRAIADLGEQRLTSMSAVNSTHTFTLEDSWARDRLVVAAWLQQDAPGPRFSAREVVQATHVELGGTVVQDTKGVLMEMLSATWCEPCLYGDLAAEAVAVAHGSAEPLDLGSGPRYFQAPPSPVLVALAAIVAGIGVAWWGGRRPA